MRLVSADRHWYVLKEDSENKWDQKWYSDHSILYLDWKDCQKSKIFLMRKLDHKSIAIAHI